MGGESFVLTSCTGWSTDIEEGDTRPCTIFIPAWGSIWGSSGFSCNNNNRGSSGVQINCMYCGLSMKTIARYKPRGTQRSWAYLFCVCFCVCGRQKPEDPQIELHGWRRHYTGRYRESGISPSICGVASTFSYATTFWYNLCHIVLAIITNSLLLWWLLVQYETLSLPQS